MRGGISATVSHGFTQRLHDDHGRRQARPQSQISGLLGHASRRAGGSRCTSARHGPTATVSLELMPRLAARGALTAADCRRRWRPIEPASTRPSGRSPTDAQEIGIGPASSNTDVPTRRTSAAAPASRSATTTIGADVGGRVRRTSRDHWAPDDGVLVVVDRRSRNDLGLIKRHGPSPEGQPAAFRYTTIWRRAGPDQPWRYVAE